MARVSDKTLDLRRVMWRSCTWSRTGRNLKGLWKSQTFLWVGWVWSTFKVHQWSRSPALSGVLAGSVNIHLSVGSWILNPLARFDGGETSLWKADTIWELGPSFTVWSSTISENNHPPDIDFVRSPASRKEMWVTPPMTSDDVSTNRKRQYCAAINHVCYWSGIVRQKGIRLGGWKTWCRLSVSQSKVMESLRFPPFICFRSGLTTIYRLYLIYYLYTHSLAVFIMAVHGIGNAIGVIPGPICSHFCLPHRLHCWADGEIPCRYWILTRLG